MLNRVRRLANIHRGRSRGGTIQDATDGGFGSIMTRCLTALAVALAVTLSAVSSAGAVDAVNVRLDASAIDLTAATEVQKTEIGRAHV